MSSSDEKKGIDVLKYKTDARNDRLTLKKWDEEQFRKKFQIEDQEKCKEYFRAFGDCAKRNNILVAFNCRQENRAMSDCMDRNCSDAEFNKYLEAHGLPAAQPRKSFWASFLG
jgi:hypothetical protein